MQPLPGRSLAVSVPASASTLSREMDKSKSRCWLNFADGTGNRVVEAPVERPLHRQTWDFPGSLGPFFQHRRLRVSHGDDLAATHLPVAEVDVMHRFARAA